MKEWEVWKERDSALTALVKENKDYISQSKGGAGEFTPRCAGKHGVIFLSLSDLTSLAKCS